MKNLPGLSAPFPTVKGTWRTDPQESEVRAICECVEDEGLSDVLAEIQ